MHSPRWSRGPPTTSGHGEPVRCDGRANPGGSPLDPPGDQTNESRGRVRGPIIPVDLVLGNEQPQAGGDECLGQGADAEHGIRSDRTLASQPGLRPQGVALRCGMEPLRGKQEQAAPSLALRRRRWIPKRRVAQRTLGPTAGHMGRAAHPGAEGRLTTETPGQRSRKGSEAR
jgi:hypothetical protein